MSPALPAAGTALARYKAKRDFGITSEPPP